MNPPRTLLGPFFSGLLLAVASACPLTARAATWTIEDWRPTLSSDDGRFSASLRARLQLDTASFDQADDVNVVTPERDVEFKHLKSRTIARRIYLGLEGRAFANFWYEYRMDFGGTDRPFSDPFVNIARIAYNFGDFSDPARTYWRINVGLIKPVFLYDDSTSSAALTFLERADVVNVAAAGYGGGIPRLGAELTFQQGSIFRPGDNLVISGAFTGHNGSGRNGHLAADRSHEGNEVLGRIAYRLWSDESSSLQLGASASRLLKVAENKDTPGLRAVTLQDFPELRVDGNNLGSVYFQGEYYRFTIDRDLGCAGCVAAPNPAFFGWYVQASWILTGETKEYQAFAMNNNFAVFANPRLRAPVSPGANQWGAWEIAARYSDLDLNWREGLPGMACAGAFAGCVRGGEEKIVTLGLNWYVSNNVRLMFDYLIVDVDRLNASGQQIGQTFNAFATRLQLTN